MNFVYGKIGSAITLDTLNSDINSIIIDSEGRQQMVYKHAISTFTPQRPVSLMQQEAAE